MAINDSFQRIYHGDRYSGYSAREKLFELMRQTDTNRSRLARYRQLIKNDGGNLAGIGLDLAFGALEHGSVPGVGRHMSGVHKRHRADPSDVSGTSVQTAYNPRNVAKGQSAVARNFDEELAIAVVRGDPSAGKKLVGMNSNDINFHSKYGWQIMERNVKFFDPRGPSSVTVHYQVNSRAPNLAWDVKIVWAK